MSGTSISTVDGVSASVFISSNCAFRFSNSASDSLVSNPYAVSSAIISSRLVISSSSVVISESLTGISTVDVLIEFMRSSNDSTSESLTFAITSILTSLSDVYITTSGLLSFLNFSISLDIMKTT